MPLSVNEGGLVNTSENDNNGTSLPPVCYFCYDAVDVAGQPLRRDCACRGTDAGFVHLACLTNYAETKSKQARDMNQFSNQWRLCPGCHQKYQNELAVDIANKFVIFVRTQYPDDTQMQVEALYVKSCALMDMLDRLQPVQKIEAGFTINELLSMIDRMKANALLSRRYSQMEAKAYGAHGRLAFNEGTEESVRRAVTHFEDQLEVFEAIGVDDGIATAKQNIAIAKSKYKGGSNEEVLKTLQELYELCVAKHGEEDEYTILAGKDYAICLQKANRGDEARELLTKLLATSKQILGSHHNTTKKIESKLE
jgi:hypothetical protein